MYGSPTRMRMEQDAVRRNTAPVVISSILSLLVVGIAIAAVAWLVLREPSSAVDSAERLEPVGTALPAPTEAPALPTAVPTKDAKPEPTALGFSGEAPPVAGLPTVVPETVVPEVDAGPTPTPRVIDLPTAVPTAPPPPPPTLPPPAPENSVPVVALQPVDPAPPPPTAAAPSAPPAESVTRQPTPVPTPNRNDNDPFHIFDNTSESRIVPALDNPVPRVRDRQDGQSNGDTNPAAGRVIQPSADPLVIPTIAMPAVVVPTPDIPPIVPSADAPISSSRDKPVEVVMPDVDAMIDEITARTLDPNRNPNVGDAGRGVIDRDNNNRDANNRKNSRDRGRSKTPTPRAGVPNIVPSSPRGNSRPGQSQGQCDNPFAALPPDKQPKNFPFDNC